MSTPDIRNAAGIIGNAEIRGVTIRLATCKKEHFERCSGIAVPCS